MVQDVKIVRPFVTQVEDFEGDVVRLRKLLVASQKDEEELGDCQLAIEAKLPEILRQLPVLRARFEKNSGHESLRAGLIECAQKVSALRCPLKLLEYAAEKQPSDSPFVPFVRKIVGCLYPEIEFTEEAVGLRPQDNRCAEA